MDLSAYQLNPLRKDGELVLYRGVHDNAPDGALSRVLVVAPATEYASPTTLARLEHECALAPDLDPRWAARPAALVRDQARTLLVLDDAGGEPLDRLLGEPMEAGTFLQLASGIAHALAGVHDAGLIHKDIKPGNILVTPVSGAVRLTGFGIASRLARERQVPEPPQFIAGTLAYMAPEQTGRMNRSIDSRSDLYALGVTFYQMLTGDLPFSATDPMEWVHCHIARKPLPPAERLPSVQPALSELVVKLIAKTAEDRYQTAAGVEHDLRRCSVEWERHRRIESFALGERDTPDRLLMPEKLYGREREVHALLDAFDRVVASGSPELVLVSGYSGIGKSSVVNELHKVMAPPRGLFAAGKFDQYKRDIPYATLAQAFQSLVRPLLGKSDAELNGWRDVLREALGGNGRLMVDLVPELELIIGQQPPVAELPPQDAQRRFQLLFQRLIGVFARQEHPLALFLDDLQWLDAATLDLLEDLLTHSDLQHLMLIGAYRDSEVTAAHPLMRKLDAIKAAGGKVEHITLAPLGREHVGRLMADALGSESEHTGPLAQLVHEKTGGNPFFAVQFIASLADEGLLAFDHDARRWSWDLDRIHAKRYSDNVVDLMVGKLARLPTVTQHALQQLACLGNVAEISTLSLVLGASEEEVHGALWPAVRYELVEHTPGAYRFAHDRVHESAYILIPEERRAEEHLRIGRLLASHLPPEKREEGIFELAGQLNRGAALITGPEERERLAELNLIAGRRAKAATAYASALSYLSAGVALLPEDSWERRHELVFELELHRAECEFLTGALAEAEKRLTALSARAATTVERASVTCLRADLYTTLDQSSRAVAVGLEYLRHVGVEWSSHPTEDEARLEYERVWSQLGSRTIEALIDLPLMHDAAFLATFDVLSKMITPAYFVDANLHLLITCRQVNLSLEHGNCDASCFAYVWLATVAGTRFGDYKAAYRFGRLGYDLVEHRGLKRFQPATQMLFASLVMPWTKHLKSSRDLLRRAFEGANRIGDLTYAAYICHQMSTNMLAAGDSLVETQREIEAGLEFTRKVRFGFIVDLISTKLALVRMLRGLTRKLGSFDDEQFDEQEMERRFAGNPDLALCECWYSIYKLQARFLAGDYAEALEAASTAQRLLRTANSPFATAEYHFYSALSHAASCDFAAGDQRWSHVEALTASHRQLKVWAANCPDNFESRAALVGAEIARLEGREVDAERLYEQAIRAARASGFINHEALANELAARFYAARGFEQFAHLCLRTARQGYVSWGADAKVRQLDDMYPQLRKDELGAAPTSTIGVPVEHLDLATVIKVSQAVSGEIVRERLVETLLRTAIQYAGAVRGLVIVPERDELIVEAETTTSGDTTAVNLRQTPVSAGELPQSIVRYVARKQEHVIIDDASVPNPFSSDEYIRAGRARSVLCLPLVKQGALVALLYLENNLAPNVFTPGRLTVLKVLASAAAMSIDNSRLYRELETREARIRRLVDANIMGVATWRLDGAVVEANDAFLRMVGCDREDLVAGRIRWTQLTPVEWREADERALAELAATGTAQPYEKEFFRKDGSRVPLLIGNARLEETATHGIAFTLDLGRQKQAEVAVQEARSALTHMARVATVGEVTGSLAHELNQPLAAIVNNANACLGLLERGRPDLGEVREALRDIVSDSNRAASVIDGVRRLAKRSRAEQISVRLSSVVADVVALTATECGARHVAIQTDVPADLPIVTGDPVQLQQVLLNLIVNGMDAMTSVDPAERRLEIRGWQEPDAARGAVRLSIADRGIGLPDGEAERLFQTFYTTKPHGLGLGLTISRSIIESHGGRLWAEPNDGPGATFTFVLPAAAIPS